MDLNSKLRSHNERNDALLQAFTNQQVNIHQTRSIELHFWAWSQSNSVRLAQELYKKGFMLILLKPALLQDDPERWNIEAGAGISIAAVVAPEFTASLVDLASNLEADYDGWGTVI